MRQILHRDLGGARLHCLPDGLAHDGLDGRFAAPALYLQLFMPQIVAPDARDFAVITAPFRFSGQLEELVADSTGLRGLLRQVLQQHRIFRRWRKPTLQLRPYPTPPDPRRRAGRESARRMAYGSRPF